MQKERKRDRQEATVLVVNMNMDSTARKRITNKSLEQIRLIRLHCEYKSGKMSSGTLQKINKIWGESLVQTQFL